MIFRPHYTIFCLLCIYSLALGFLSFLAIFSQNKYKNHYENRKCPHMFLWTSRQNQNNSFVMGKWGVVFQNLFYTYLD